MIIRTGHPKVLVWYYDKDIDIHSSSTIVYLSLNLMDMKARCLLPTEQIYKQWPMPMEGVGDFFYSM